MKNNIKNKKAGYTIIETMIAVAIFTIIVVIGMGALLNANNLYNKSKNMRSIMDSLSYTMDDMSRSLRTGYDYYCIQGGQQVPSYGYAPSSGSNCMGVAFEPQGGGPVWAYRITQQGTIQKTTDDGNTWVQLTPDEITIDINVSAFSVIGAELPPDIQQPFVIIRLKGQINYKTITTPFSLQTSVSQRDIDI